ncbi:MAG: type II toxin-antitoxin system Phd/YefM family antitoxin [Longimicrobiales bacterium]
MSISYTMVREKLAQIWTEVENSQEEVILTRRGHEDLALVPARELRSLRETAHLMRSPRNAERLLRALEGSRKREGRGFSSIEDVAAEIGQ